MPTCRVGSALASPSVTISFFSRTFSRPNGIAAACENCKRELKFSQAAAMPFGRLKVRLKKEIVTLGDANADPTRQVGIYVEPSEWNALIAAPETLLLDTRNSFEVAMGSFEGALDPN